MVVDTIIFSRQIWNYDVPAITSNFGKLHKNRFIRDRKNIDTGVKNNAPQNDKLTFLKVPN